MRPPLLPVPKLSAPLGSLALSLASPQLSSANFALFFLLHFLSHSLSLVFHKFHTARIFRHFFIRSYIRINVLICFQFMFYIELANIFHFSFQQIFSSQNVFLPYILRSIYEHPPQNIYEAASIFIKI